MTEKKNIVGVVLARGGSKGVPRKNVRPILGTPLVAYSIEAALASKVLDRVILTTDDEEIAKAGRKYGAEVPFMRPAELAEDTTHTPPVIEHAVNYLEEKEDYKVDVVVTLEPTSPLRTPKHIQDGVKKFLESNVKSLISVNAAFPPWWLLKFNGDKVVPFLEYEKGVNAFNLERQQLPTIYMPNGVLYVTDRAYLREHGSIVCPEDCGAIITDEESSIDIDTEAALKLVELVMVKRQEGEK